MQELKCKHCKRHLGEAESIVGDIICPGCKGSSQFKIVPTNFSKLYGYVFTKAERPPKTKEPITNNDAKPLKAEVS